jgi:hypothetical protein
MNRTLVLRLGLALCLAALPAVASAATANVHILNKSKWDIHNFYLSSVDEDDWGPDQLGEHVLEANGGSFELQGIPCDSYDVMLVDEDEDQCIIPEVDFCAADQGWIIKTADLLECEGYE